jgi:hypothetical protein
VLALALVLPIIMLSIFVGSVKASVFYDHANFSSHNGKFTVKVIVYKHEDVIQEKDFYGFEIDLHTDCIAYFDWIERLSIRASSGHFDGWQPKEGLMSSGGKIGLSPSGPSISIGIPSSHVVIGGEYTNKISWYVNPIGGNPQDLEFAAALWTTDIYSDFKWEVYVNAYSYAYGHLYWHDYVTYSTFGGGCPILSVYDGSDYVEEGLLDIHNPEGTDLVYDHSLASTPQRVDGAYLLRLTEHPKTHSYIDQVKLYAVLEDGTMKELPLIWACHSEDGNVLPMLLHSDEWKTDTLGADHNDGTSQSIDLKFAALSPNLEVTGFAFQIEGNNMLIK